MSKVLRSRSRKDDTYSVAHGVQHTDASCGGVYYSEKLVKIWINHEIGELFIVICRYYDWSLWGPLVVSDKCTQCKQVGPH